MHTCVVTEKALLKKSNPPYCISITEWLLYISDCVCVCVCVCGVFGAGLFFFFKLTIVNTFEWRL